MPAVQGLFERSICLYDRRYKSTVHAVPTDSAVASALTEVRGEVDAIVLTHVNALACGLPICYV